MCKQQPLASIFLDLKRVVFYSMTTDTLEKRRTGTSSSTGLPVPGTVVRRGGTKKVEYRRTGGVSKPPVWKTLRY